MPSNDVQRRSRIAGVGAYLPARVVTSAQIEARLGFGTRPRPRPGLIEVISGVRERRYAAETEWASDLATAAARSALSDAGVTPEEIDVCIFAAATQDVTEPATANIVMAKLGIARAVGFDVKNACTSFLSALEIGDALISLGRARVVLVASGEISSRYVNWEIPSDTDLTKELASFTLGDGGGAAVLLPADPNAGMRASGFINAGEHWELATVMYGGTAFPRDIARSYFVSRSEDLLAVAEKLVPPLIARVVEQAGWRIESIDLVVPHQAGRRMIARIAGASGIKMERCALTLERYGNTVAASIPITLADTVTRGRISAGSRVLLVSAAAGFSAGVVAIEW